MEAINALKDNKIDVSSSDDNHKISSKDLT